MLNAKFLRELDAIGAAYTADEPMALHTTFKIGGKADALVNVSDEAELKSVLRLCRNFCVPFFILGHGSNLLVSDDGIEGAVISLAGMNDVRASGNEMICSAGALLGTVCNNAVKSGLSGLEFAYGIPGSVGGALYMNAGAYGGDMSQVVKSAVCVNPDGETVTLDVSEMELGYRTSVFKKNSLIITQVTFELKPDDAGQIKSRMDDFMSRRRSKQPLDFPSAGSTFKRPEGYFAGTLIEQNGLKGVSVGGAQVSEKHAGFVINKGGATCKDVKSLIEVIRKKVNEASGVTLEPEIIFVGREERNGK